MNKHQKTHKRNHGSENIKKLVEELDQESRKEIAREYARFASLHQLSEEDADRLSQILELAQQDSVLEFLIGEVDHFMDHELELWDLEYDKKQRCNLKAFLASQSNPLSEQDFLEFYEELRLRIRALGINSWIETQTNVPINIHVKFHDLHSEGSHHEVYVAEFITMDISLMCNDNPTLRLGSTNAEDAAPLKLLITHLPQPYADLVNAHRFIRDNRSLSDRELKFTSSSIGSALTLREAITSSQCVFDEQPLEDHKFKVIESCKANCLNPTKV